MGFFLRLLVVAALLSGGPPLRQEKSPPQEALQYEVTVSLKLVQVYVTDKNGQPVADLNKEDFIVLDDGKPVAVTDFERHPEFAYLRPSGQQSQRWSRRVEV
jgi:hypothetical protein